MMPCWRGIWVVVLVAAGSVSCSSSSGGGGGAKGDAADECHAYVQKACEKLATCEGSSVSDCVSQANAGIKDKFGETCDGADIVGASYNQCMTDLDALTCPASSVPASCQNVVLFQ